MSDPTSAAPYRSVAARKLAAPPRQGPGKLKLRLYFGGGLAQIGWFVCAISSIVIWVIVPSVDFGALTESGPYERVEGQVLHSEPTSISVNNQRIMAVDFVVETAGHSHLGTSYVRGNPPADGARVPVEIPHGRLDRARVEGMSLQPTPAWVLLVLLPLPLAALVLLLVRGRHARLEVRLLTIGRVDSGRLVHRETTRLRVNNRPVHKLSFDFEDAEGRAQRVVVRTTNTDRLTDDALEPLVYDRAHPRHAALLDSLPGAPRIDEGGRLAYDASPWGMLTALGPPALVLLVNLVALLMFSLS